MFKLTRKQIILMSTILFISNLLIFVQVVNAEGGNNPSTAPTYTPGIYPNEQFTTSGESYYNVSGRVGANLTVIVFCNKTDPNVIIWSPNGTHLGLATTIAPKTQKLSVICDSDKLYTIQVGDPDTGVLKGYGNFTLTIILPEETTEGIPGFFLIPTLIGILMIAAMIIKIKTRKHL